MRTKDHYFTRNCYIHIFAHGASSLSDSESFSYTPDNLTDQFDVDIDHFWPVAYSSHMTIGDKH